MTWQLNRETGEITAPWGDVVETIDRPFRTPEDIQDVAESMFREQSMTNISTERIADYAQAWMGDVEVVN